MNIEEIIEQAKEIVNPKPEERKYVEEVTNYILSILENELTRLGYSDIKISVQGSIAKDTWLPNARDIDIFVIFPKTYNISIFNKLINDLIEIANKYNINWVIKYAQHPYIQYLFKDFEIDIVPCFKIEKNEKPITAADRTPLHTKYILSKLKPEQRIEVRLLKRFMKNIGVYGAEIKVEGFSGYLCELLIIAYENFLNLVKNVASNWKPGKIVIDIEHYYSDDKVVKKLFKDASIIVIDPVDRNRNAAAAVSKETLCTFIAACKYFLRKPSIKFFTTQELAKSIKILAPSIIIEFKYPNTIIPDTIWGELKRMVKAFENVFKKFEFKVYHSGIWTDEKERIYLMFTFEKLELPDYELHQGPPVYSDDSIKFIEKYLNDESIVGPFIKGSRWYVIKKRKFKTVEDIVRAHIVQIAPKHLKKVCSEFKIYRIEDVEDFERINLPTNVREVVKKFLIKQPSWLT